MEVLEVKHIQRHIINQQPYTDCLTTEHASPRWEAGEWLRQTWRHSWKLRVIWTAHKSQLLDLRKHNSCSRGVRSFGVRQCWFVFSHRRFETACRSHLQGSSSILEDVWRSEGNTLLILNMAPVRHESSAFRLFRPLNSGKWFFFRFKDQISLTLKTFDFTNFVRTFSYKLRVWWCNYKTGCHWFRN
jgi:hypothetical protein